MSHADFVKLMRERRVGDFGPWPSSFRRGVPGTKFGVPSVSETQMLWDPSIDAILGTGAGTGAGAGTDSSGARYYTYKRQAPLPPTPSELEKRGRWNESILVLNRELMESPQIEAGRKNLANALVRYGRHFQKLGQSRAALHQFRRAKFVYPAISVDVADLAVLKPYPPAEGILAESKVKDRIAQMTKQLFDCPKDARTRRCLASWYVFYGDLLRKRERAYDADLQYRCALFVDKDNIEVYKRDCVCLVIGPNLKSDECTSPLPP